MSRIKLLLDVVSDLRSLADSLQAVAKAMAQNEAEQPEKPAEEKTIQKSEKKQTAKKTEKTTTPPAPEEKPLTMEEVRMVLAEKSRAGQTAEVRALLIKHGAEKLSDIDPARYPALLADAEVL